tara:strand:- start:179 stop:457 length:279 start_codon:yes stop_codon:yes gene_type:complete
MTQEQFDKAPLTHQLLYDCTGMMPERHPSLIEMMELYHKAKLKEITDSEILDLIDDLSLDVMDYPERDYGIPTEKPFVNTLIKTVKDWINKL